MEIKAPPSKNSMYFFTLPLKKSSIFITYSIVPQPGGGGGGGGGGGEVRVLNAIAQWYLLYHQT